MYERGWSTLKNDAVLSIAEQAGYDALVTADRQLRYRQYLARRELAIGVLLTTSWLRIQQHVASVQQCLLQ
jgi:hypothetical protein